MKRYFAAGLMLILQFITMRVHAEEEHNLIELSDISYKYEMFYDERGNADCNGVLELTINVPPEYYFVSILKSRKHLTSHSQFRGGAVIIYHDAGPTIRAVLENISWGTYFQTQLALTVDDRFLAPDFCVDDYIDKDDLAIIKGQAEISEVQSDDVEIMVKNHFLEIDTPCNIFLNVYSIDGRHIFGGNISGHYSLPVNGGIMVVQYTLNGKTEIKKISTL